MSKIAVFYQLNGISKCPNDQPDFKEITDPRLVEMISGGSGVAYLVDYVSQNLGWQVVEYPAQVHNSLVLFETEEPNFRQTMCVRARVTSTKTLVIISAMSLGFDFKLLMPGFKFASLEALNQTLQKSGWTFVNNPHQPIARGEVRLWYTHEV